MTLTEAVLEYQKTGCGYELILGQIAVRAYNYPKGRGGFDEDDQAGFLLFFYEKVPRVVQNFTWVGKPFEAYLATCFRWQLKSYWRARKMDFAVEEVAERSEAGEPYAAVPKPKKETHISAQIFEELCSIKRVRRSTMARRFAFIALKLAAILGDDEIESIAGTAGVPADRLLDQAQVIRGRLRERQERVDTLCRRRNRLFCRLRVAEREAEEETCDKARRAKREYAESLRRRLASAIRDVETVSVLASNKDIADVTGEPKGSIDSGLHYLKSYMATKQGAVHV